MAIGLHPTPTDPDRRVIIHAAAWTIPAVALASAAPLAAASGATTVLDGSFSSLYYGWPDTTSSNRTAKYADGVTFTLLDQDGDPVPDGTPVTFTIGEYDDNSLWFVADPSTPVGLEGEVLAPQLATITLTTVNGVVDLDGYLRRGSDANSGDPDQTITANAVVGGVPTSAVAYWAMSSSDSWFGDDDPGVSGPKDEAQHVRLNGDDWL